MEILPIALYGGNVFVGHAVLVSKAFRMNVMEKVKNVDRAMHVEDST